jgi:hypothetical protein
MRNEVILRFSVQRPDARVRQGNDRRIAFDGAQACAKASSPGDQQCVFGEVLQDGWQSRQATWGDNPQFYDEADLDEGRRRAGHAQRNRPPTRSGCSESID